MKAFSLIQHKLIPTALLAGNIALAHFVYLVAKGEYSYTLPATAGCLITILIGIVRANKYLLLAGIVFYSVMLSGILIFSS